MAFKILFTEDSLNDLEAILDYIRADDPEAAARFGNDLLNYTELLATFPHIGEPVKHRERVRKLLHTPVRIYYRIDEKRQIVEILHFWHTAREEPELL
ncbi:MAG: type II toxin-antitoxin system RelE/ParE family toxin [Acidobacteria bacterium]|nr:type II toxin-antitoxin system RelE/ParE family toxin [Acidobacteriota bacterium]